MHRPGLSELEALMRHADSLPVDDVDGQAYLKYVMINAQQWQQQRQQQ